MGVEIIGVFIPIVAIIGVVIMIIYMRRFENQERMAMIEKGVSVDFFKNKRQTPSLSLRVSLLFMGVGLGLLCGYLLDVSYNMEEVAYFSMIFLFGGIGLGIAYIIEERKEKKS